MLKGMRGSLLFALKTVLSCAKKVRKMEFAV